MKSNQSAPAQKQSEPRSNVDRKRFVPGGMRRQSRVKQCIAAPLIAYDFETTRIRKGTPRPLYLTAYGEAPAFHFDGPIDSLNHLCHMLKTRFLIDELSGAKYVAWNANNFDAYFIAAALLHDSDYIMRPYLTRSNALRGLRVIPKADEHLESKSQRHWEFLDGMAMLGLAGVSLEKFLSNFAPDFAKLTDVINWEKEEFNPKNKDHCTYAYRDSEGLFKAMNRAQNIIVDTFNQPLTVTMGGACIKIFKAHIPADVFVKNLPPEPLALVREYVMRGGFCHCVDRYIGPVWKYDINQAYAAAMRECPLPSGGIMQTAVGVHRWAKTYIARLTATNPNNTIPFYYRTVTAGRVRALFATTEIFDTWLTSVEVNQLRAEGWKLNISESWFWPESFTMRDYVDKLETIRTTCSGGPSGPTGTMVKAVGNHSYGKTCEVLDNTEFLLAADRPDDFMPYYGNDLEPIPNVWFRFTEPKVKDYHQPQIGAFITAHVRMVVRRAALLSPATWLYADTDCVVFSSDVTDRLDVDAKRYGAWKIEESGTQYRIIAKKIYQNMETLQGHAKGLNVRRLTPQDFVSWYEGEPPVQEQTQRNNFVKVMAGAEMYRTQLRTGTAIV